MGYHYFGNIHLVKWGKNHGHLGFGSFKALVTSCGQIMATKFPKELSKIGGLVKDPPRPKTKAKHSGIQVEGIIENLPRINLILVK